jgi:hypothetical protein
MHTVYLLSFLGRKVTYLEESRQHCMDPCRLDPRESGSSTSPAFTAARFGGRGGCASREADTTHA